MKCNRLKKRRVISLHCILVTEEYLAATIESNIFKNYFRNFLFLTVLRLLYSHALSRDVSSDVSALNPTNGDDRVNAKKERTRKEKQNRGIVFVSIAARDPVIIERSNLVNISKLIVKELIETSLKYGRMLDSDHMPLQHFFIVLEHVLRHGLRPKKVN